MCHSKLEIFVVCVCGINGMGIKKWLRPRLLFWVVGCMEEKIGVSAPYDSMPCYVAVFLRDFKVRFDPSRRWENEDWKRKRKRGEMLPLRVKTRARRVAIARATTYAEGVCFRNLRLVSFPDLMSTRLFIARSVTWTLINFAILILL